MRLQWRRLLSGSSVLAAVCVLELCWATPAKEPPKRDCAGYKDPLIRFKCPNGWKTWFYEGSPAEGERAWYVDPPDTEKSDFGDISIIEKLDGREKRPLEQIFAETKKNAHKMTILEGPKKMAILGAKCLAFKYESIMLVNFGHIQFTPDMPPPRAGSSAHAYCYNKRGNYVEIWTKLSNYAPGKPDERYKKNAALFDDFLKTVEFK